MKLELFGIGAALCGGGLYAFWPFDQGKTYDRTPPQSYEILSRMPLPIVFDRLVEKMPGGTLVRENVPGKSVTWIFKVKGREGARFSATIEPDGEARSYVSTDFRLVDEGKAFPNAEAFETIAAPAMEEQADARLAGREFRAEVLAMPVAAYGFRHRDELVRSLEQGIAASKREDAARERRAREMRVRLQNEKAGISFTPGQPMIQTDSRRR